MRTIALMNQKGGVGKTTCVVNIGAGLARQGLRVLCVDMDPQAHLTYAMGVPAHTIATSIHDVLQGKRTAAEAIIAREGAHLLPASLDLAGADLALANLPGREFLLKQALADTSGYDIILFDCPPNLGLLATNALAAASELFIPVQAEFLALQSLSKLLETVEVVRKRLNPGLQITGIINTRYSRQKKLNREVVSTIRAHFGGTLFDTFIRDNVAIAEAPSFGKDIFAYKPDSNGARDYAALCREIARRGTHEQ